MMKKLNDDQVKLLQLVSDSGGRLNDWMMGWDSKLIASLARAKYLRFSFHAAAHTGDCDVTYAHLTNRGEKYLKDPV